MTEASYDRPLLVAMTGATGAIYGVRLLETLYELGVEAHLIVSRWAEATIKTETERRPEDLRALAAVVYDEEDLAAPPASSAFETAGMIVAPCSMRTLAAVSNALDAGGAARSSSS